jgi:hypothetical protein
LRKVVIGELAWLSEGVTVMFFIVEMFIYGLEPM